MFLHFVSGHVLHKLLSGFLSRPLVSYASCFSDVVDIKRPVVVLGIFLLQCYFFAKREGLFVRDHLTFCLGLNGVVSAFGLLQRLRCGPSDSLLSKLITICNRLRLLPPFTTVFHCFELLKIFDISPLLK